MTESVSPFNYFDSGGSLVLGKSPDGVDRVESLLTHLWSHQPGTEQTGQNLYRLCLANLVVVGQVGDQAILESFASNFASYHPSRVQLALVDPAAPNLSARLAASCRKNPSGSGVVCWEKITLTCPPGHEDQLTSAMRALLVGRIATVIAFAISPETCRTVFDRALHWADLVVTDLKAFTVVPELLYWDCRGCRASRTRWIDANWTRLTGIRRAIAHWFDQNDVREMAGRDDNLEMTIGGIPPPLDVLLAGWLVSRLGWSLKGKTANGRLDCRRPSGRIARLSFSEAANPFVTWCSDNAAGARIDLPGIGKADTSESHWESQSWPLSLIEELHGSHPDPVFLTSMDAASQIQQTRAGQIEKPVVNICRDVSALADRVAARFVQLAQAAVSQSGSFRVALSGGRTPQLLYERLAEPEFRNVIPWDQIEWFWGDERWVPPDNPLSNYRMAQRALLNRVHVAASRIHPIPTGLLNPEEAAEAYDATLRESAGVAASPFDLVLLGIGADGHTASWFPEGPMDELAYRWVWAGYVPQLGAERVSITPRAINAAHHVIFLVTGTDKAEIVAKTISPPWENRHPAARIEPHDGIIEWFLDRDAAGMDPT